MGRHQPGDGAAHDDDRPDGEHDPASAMSSRRRSGLPRQRHSRAFMYSPLGIGPSLLVVRVTLRR
ncbi:hypothetical protein OG920_41040 [Streptomyces europaeiscabiei]|uniref:hypothetical protein n=1 Tax=Streptomyces TaxID=1883 RepID=UPI00117E3F66|nr:MULTISPECIES: hypothetical protein [Streptomyces]MDX3580697.1 hypothetical protein [Streptomyces europaeiscabiei]MDX3615876.1 hypothetical protein [Streptomyces europaeiscabiei]MDX3630808.1 hypothetical protein [Streptomyces europaeiscabiei]MDX3649178.1 hypothetical protein [Streptomyces europaeiscabiei]WUD37298.1 hypothetical protein OG858_41730 [Streptomyces europaeiscabiei]